MLIYSLNTKMTSTNNSKYLDIYYQNARGLRTKTAIFKRNVQSHNYDVIIITETWLLDGINNPELVDDRYVVWRRDRNYAATGQTRGGGVLIATRRELSVTPQSSFHSLAEDLWLTLSMKQRGSKLSINLHICVLYLCDENLGFNFSQQLLNFLTNLDSIIMLNPYDKYLVVGDFNMSDIVWTPNVYDGTFDPSHYRSENEILLIDELNALNLKQYNGIRNHYGKTLDLVLSNDTFVVTDCSDDPLSLPIDRFHGALSLHAHFVECDALDCVPFTRYLFDKGDYVSINEEISGIDWLKELTSRTFESAVDYFYEMFSILRDKYVPSKLIKTDPYPKWYTRALKKVIKEKFKYLRKYKKYGNLSDEQSYKILRDRAKALEVSCHNNYIALVESSIERNPKYFWSYYKSKSKSNVIPSSLKYNNSIANDGEAICNAFSTYFCSTFSNASNSHHSSNVDSLSQSHSVSDISSILTNVDTIANLLHKLDPSKSAGPDHMPARFLINCAKTISLPISILFKRSIAEGYVPCIWKRAFITPVHKKGAKTDITNYRPISKLCIVSKVFEKVVFNQLYPALKQSFSPFQHGFLKGRSTVSNLISLNSYLTEAMDNGHQVDVVYTDYSKAFDRIPHKLLLFKLHKVGICGDLFRWFSSYIDNRTQAVVVNNYMSSWVPIPSGVPQGSLLGPLLFTLFVNDIDSCFQTSHLLCFADDMKIYTSISSVSDAEKLQADLVRLESYCAINQLDLNPLKCSTVTFTRKYNVVLFDYTLKGLILPRNTTMRDLGVVHDSKLLFDDHINTIVSKAYKALGFVKRCSKEFTKVKTFKILYCTYVRSNLEYASQIWNPMYATYINRIESIQRKFIRYLCFRIGVHYDSTDYLYQCNRHHLLPLENRRVIADLVFLLKIASGAIDCPSLLSQLFYRVPSKVLRSNALIYLPSASTNYRMNTFIWRASNSFNNLSEEYDLDLFNTSIMSARRQLAQSFFTAG